MTRSWAATSPGSLPRRWKTPRNTAIVATGTGAMTPRRAASMPITAFHSRKLFSKETPMSKERPTDDPRRQSDWGSHTQTDKPWKGNPENEQKSGDAKPDLEKWQESKTH